MGSSYLGLSAVGWHAMLGTWWNRTIAYFLAVTIFLGSLYLVVRTSLKLKRYWLARRTRHTAIPEPVLRHLARLTATVAPLCKNQISANQGSSFGVYLGSFSHLPTRCENRILSQWDIVVLNPLASGVLSAISSPQASAIHRLGRLSIRTIAPLPKSVDNASVISSLGTTMDTLLGYFKGSHGDPSPYTGVLLADFQEHFQPPVLNELVKAIKGLGFSVWLELSPPDYLDERDCRYIDFNSIHGIVYRNGTIRTDGEQQDYHQMSALRKVQRAVAAQRVPHGPRLLLWETIHDEFDHQYAVTARCFNWCTFNSAVPWIGFESALTHADTAETATIANKPLGALMFLKDDQNMRAHDTWRTNHRITREVPEHDALLDSLQGFVPDLKSKLRFLSPESSPGMDGSRDNIRHQVRYSQALRNPRDSPLSVSGEGDDFTGLGCFQLGLEASSQSFDALLDAQRHLRDLDLLQRLSSQELQEIRARLAVLQLETGSRIMSELAREAVQELLDLLAQVSDAPDSALQVFVGLHSGFQTGAQEQFWGLYDNDAHANQLTLYLSKFAQCRESTILHTFLSSRGCTRVECFMAEFALSQQSASLSKAWSLPSRMVHDIEALSPAETIMLLRQLTVKRELDSFLLARIRACCEYQLMDVPTLSQLRAKASASYLRGHATAESVVHSRLAWLETKGFQHPNPVEVVGVFQEVDSRLHAVLMLGESELYQQLGAVLRTILQEDHIGPASDIVALAVFSAFRRLALDELYLEVMDRNAFPNHAQDQAGCFAENFGVGSRCDSFFDFTPRVLGEILSERYRAYYHRHQPPHREPGFTELPTTFAAMQIDVDTDFGDEKIPTLYKFTFLGIFAVPALIDIGLLTTVGRGLYLTTFMTSTQKTMATTALMLALLVCGAVGSWITSGGCYYVYASAFPAMNMFVLTRFVAGMAVILISGAISLVTVACVVSVADAFIFLFYFIMLSVYLLLLSTLSIYQIPGSSFQSGRTVIMTCIPILFISPVLTIFVQRDIIVYLSVLTIFVMSLLFGARKIMSEWSSWYLRIPSTTDAEVTQWYAEKRGFDVDGQEMKALVLAGEPRRALQAAVVKESNRNLWNSADKDPLVSRLANSYTSTKFLMLWYCRHRRTQMPLPYSPTWNLTLKAGLENITNMQKGLKLHSAFLHWRQTGADVWSGLLYFVVALLDKWAALVSGGALVGLSAANSEQFRLAVGFGLCYYLIGAVSLDAVSQPLWTAANEKTDQAIPSIEFLRQANKNDAKARRRLYWTNFVKFALLHIWGASVTAALMWTFESSREATIMYLAYVGAYTGLLLYQYNKIYMGNDGAKSLAVASILGLPAGIALHLKLPHYPYSGVIALAFGTWISAIHSLTLCGIGWEFNIRSRSTSRSSATDETLEPVERAQYSHGSLEPATELSQATLAKMFNSVRCVAPEQRFVLDAEKHPGARVMDHLALKAQSHQVEAIASAFPSSQQILRQTIELWRSGRTVVELVGSRHFPPSSPAIQMLSEKLEGRLHVFVALGPDVTSGEWTIDIHRSSLIIAEAIVQATCESHLGLSRSHACLAQLLVADSPDGEAMSIPEGFKQQLEISTSARAHIFKSSNRLLLQYLLLDIDCEVEWDLLPDSVRSMLMQRLSGKSFDLSVENCHWIQSKGTSNDELEPEEFIARCNLGALLTVAVKEYATAFDVHRFASGGANQFTNSSSFRLLAPASESRGTFKRFVIRSCQVWRAAIKFLILSLVADPEFQRELDYMVSTQSQVVRLPVVICLNSIWIFCKGLQDIIIPLVLFNDRDKITTLRNNMKGTKTIVKSKRIAIETLRGPSTCFWTSTSNNTLRVSQYEGRHEREPGETATLVAVNEYSAQFALLRRDTFAKGELVGSYTYEYEAGASPKGSRMPMQRQCMKGRDCGEIVRYDERGFMTSGSFFRGVNPVQFTYWYRRSAKFDDELLRGEYVFPHITVRILWSVPPRKHAERLEDWIPFHRVTEATFIQGADVYHASWTYEHKLHPEITTTLNGEAVETPPMIGEDWFHVIEKPQNCSFLGDNPLLAFSSVKTNFFSRLFRLNIKRYPISTSHARTQVWKQWKNGRDLDAITACWLDEHLMRSDTSLRSYWRNRDLGLLSRAKSYLDAQADTIMARTDFDSDVSSWVHIALKIADLYSFGPGGDSTINTRTAGQIQDNDKELHVLAMDTSTWPMEPGGVSACRRDMVNDLKTTKWHVVAEMANDYGIPRFQIERNVKSLTILPLWGLDFLNPTHGVLQNSLDSAVVQRSYDTRTSDIQQNFVPILRSLVRCARTLHPSRVTIEEATGALIDLNTYFESSRNWNDVWRSEVVKATWRELWLTEEQDDTLKISDWWDFEKPTLKQLDQALDMWHRYLFILSIPVPETIPDVFQASHHFCGATYGILCKIKRECTLHVWDHCISFREFTTFMSSAVSFDMPFVNSSLMSLGHLACVLLEYHADVVLPCADYFNPGWEVELGTANGALMHRRTFARKIDPVVNGICNMEKFEPIKEIKTDTPTVVMLSHIQFVKDIKNAILATDLIVNKWGFKDYRLHVYGDMERAAGHSTECQELIASKGLGDHCVLKGLGNPSIVLQDAWLFLNSSISEGLPLAMGEAALTGVPVVCTDVGASFCVVTDRATGNKFSEVVPPNDSESLARAQINVMALIGKWASHGADEPGVTVPVLSYPNPTPDEVRAISERMYKKKEQRRNLGMKGRDNVLNNFSAGRYLREHEQMLWIGKHRSPSYYAKQCGLKKNFVSSSNSSLAWVGREKPAFGATITALATPPRTPRLPPQQWSSAASSRAPSVMSFKDRVSERWGL